MGSQDDWLISPTFTPSGNYKLKWWDVVESSFYNNTYDVYVFPNGDITAGVNLGTYDCVNTDLQQHVLDLSAYDGQAISLGFHQTFSSSTYYGFGIEDVTVEPAPTAPELVLSSSSLDFGDVFISSSSQLTLTVTNNGGADATGTITVDNDKFVVGSTALNVPFGSSQDIVVTYTPTDELDDVGSITLTHNGASSPNTVQLTGAGSLSILIEDLMVFGLAIQRHLKDGQLLIAMVIPEHGVKQIHIYLLNLMVMVLMNGSQDDWLISLLYH